MALFAESVVLFISAQVLKCLSCLYDLPFITIPLFCKTYVIGNLGFSRFSKLSVQMIE